MPQCFHEKCKKRACYNLQGENTGLYCKTHKSSDMVSIVTKRCNMPDCNTVPSFNYPGEKKGFYCKSHHLNGMVDVINVTCAKEDCNKHPSFNYPSEKKALYCRTHKLEGMIDVVHAKCRHNGCLKIPSWTNPGESTKLYCGEHKLEGMVNSHTTCLYNECNKRPSYNNPEEISPLYCAKHALPQMINVTSKRCVVAECGKVPIFNEPGGKALYCATHKLDGMINVTKTLCAYDGCNKEPVYNISGEKKGLYCLKHKTGEMMDVRNAGCVYNGCIKRASYNNPGEKKALYCVDHKLQEMIYLNRKNCQADGCDRRASYGTFKNSKVHCDIHRLEGEFKVTNCIKCKRVAMYGLPDERIAILCENHHGKEHINLFDKECKTCHFEMILDNDGICECCSIGTKQVRVKETIVKQFLMSKTNLKIESCDKTIDTSCNHNRPDIVIDALYFKIIVEIDEHQHKSYTAECENVRMIMIHQAFGGTPVVFIRYNPDSYIDHQCAQQDPPRNIRLKALYSLIHSLMNNKEWHIPLSKYYLFYDGFDCNLPPEQIEMPYHDKYEESVSELRPHVANDESRFSGKKPKKILVKAKRRRSQSKTEEKIGIRDQF